MWGGKGRAIRSKPKLHVRETGWGGSGRVPTVGNSAEKSRKLRPEKCWFAFNLKATKSLLTLAKTV